MLITEEFLQRHNACRDGLYRFTKNFPTGGHIDDVLRAVICSNGAEAHWVSWLMIRARYRSTDWLNNNPSVGWSLDLRGTGVTSLPDNLSVGVDLDLQGTGITSLPDNLSVGGRIYQ